MNLYGLVTIMKLNVGRGYVVHNSESGSHEGGYRAARAAKKNANIQKSKNSIFYENLKSPQKSGCFDNSGSPVALFVAEISQSRFFVTDGGRMRNCLF